MNRERRNEMREFGQSTEEVVKDRAGVQEAEQLLRDRAGSWAPDSMFESLQSEEQGLYEYYLAELVRERRRAATVVE